MKLKKSTFQVSKHLLTLQNRRSQGQRTKERRRKSYYSGKKKKHTIKTQYRVNGEGTILLHKTGHDRGRIHDYEIFKNKHPINPLQVENVFDLGYMGVKNDFPTVKSILPIRKNRKKSELSNEEKKLNRKHSKLRVIVEHTVSRIKKFGIMGTKIRETGLEDMIML